MMLWLGLWMTGNPCSTPDFSTFGLLGKKTALTIR